MKSPDGSEAKVTEGRPIGRGRYLWRRKLDQPYWREVEVGLASGGGMLHCNVKMGGGAEDFYMCDSERKYPWCGMWILLEYWGDEEDHSDYLHYKKREREKSGDFSDQDDWNPDVPLPDSDPAALTRRQMQELLQMNHTDGR